MSGGAESSKGKRGAESSRRRWCQAGQEETRQSTSGCGQAQIMRGYPQELNTSGRTACQQRNQSNHVDARGTNGSSHPATRLKDKSKDKDTKDEPSKKSKRDDEKRCYYCQETGLVWSQCGSRLKDLADAEERSMIANSHPNDHSSSCGNALPTAK